MEGYARFTERTKALGSSNLEIDIIRSGEQSYYDSLGMLSSQKIESSKRFLVKSKAYLEMPKRLHDEKSFQKNAL